MEMQFEGNWEMEKLHEELLLVEDSILFTRSKLRYFPSDNKPELSRLSERRARIVAMIEGGCTDE